MDDILDFGKMIKEDRSDSVLDTADIAFPLNQLVHDYVFFNHGAFFTYAEFKDPEEDPLNDWHDQQERGTELIKQPYDRPLFERLDAPCFEGRLTWNNVLCAVSHEHWQSLFEFLGGVVAYNDNAKRLYLASSGTAHILDPVLVERHGLLTLQLPTVPVVIFGIDSNVARWEISPIRISMTAPPRIARLPPRPETVTLAEQVFKGDLSGLAARTTPAGQQFLDQYRKLIQEGINADNTGTTDADGGRSKH